MTRSLIILLWLVSVGALLFIQSCNSPAPVQSYNTDMFPLKKGLQLKYSYNRNLTSNNNRWTDSGYVKYLIKDSIDVSAALRVWIISEEVNLLHQYYFLTDQLGGARLDSSYIVAYNTIDTLKETLQDSHLLTCNALIWKFPLDVNSISPEPFYRYSSASSPVLSYDNEYQSGPGNSVEHYSTTIRQLYKFQMDTGLISISNESYYYSDVSLYTKVLKVTRL